MADYVPIDALTREQLYVVVYKAIGTDVPKAILDKMTDALVHHQGGWDHFLSQAWERGVSDQRQVQSYPFIESHMISPYEQALDEDEQTDCSI